MAESNEDLSGRVEIPAPRRVRDVVGTTRHEIDTQRAVEGMVAGLYDEYRADCPRCGESVFLSKDAVLGTSWHCGACGAHGTIGETP